jgi:hypothetical protein
MRTLLEDTIRTTLARLGIAETALAIPATIRHRAATVDQQADPLADLHQARADLVTLRELGRGGMGVVHLAEQRSLDRQVAMKVATSSDVKIVGGLLREARIMGALEHPNVVPVHWLGVDATGAPLLVMKRIEGATWRTLLDEPDHAAWGPLLVGHGDRLRAHVEILADVSRALSFAHDRGVIHRDLKPENVMIGRFGEVYLLDWGAALRLAERATEPPGLAGTPAYLAPEMARADPMLIDARTDVYLLGATLYDVVTGRMPHDAPTAIAALMKALSGEPLEVPATVPAELRRLILASTSEDKDARPPTAEAFRAALLHFLLSRDAEAVATAARTALGRATALVAAEGPASSEAYRYLIEARFGFTTAHRLLPDDVGIASELQNGIAQLVEREISVRSPATARALLAELAEPSRDQLDRLEALERDVRRGQEAALAHEEARRELDTTTMRDPFSWILLGMGTFGVVIAPLAYRIAASGRDFPVSEALAFDAAGFAALVIAFAVSRRALLATKATRRIASAYGIACMGAFVSDCVSYSMGHTVSQAATHSMTLAAVVTAITATTLMPRLWLALPILVADVAGTVLWPRFASVFVVITLTTVAIVYTQGFRVQSARSRSGR